MDKILERDYNLSGLNAKVKEFDSYASKLDKYVGKQGDKTKELVKKITEYNDNLNDIFERFEYNKRKSEDV